MTFRLARAGVGLALLYVVVAVATAQLSSRPVLPLFDGFAPPTPYAWVNPPPERATDNVAPRSVEQEFPLGPEGVTASNAATADAQAILGLDHGSVPPHPPDTAVRARLTPMDPGTLGPLPPGLRAVSNAYRVELAYVPSDTPVERLARQGTIALTAGDTANRFLYSADGRTWEERTFRPYGQDHGLFTELQSVGWFVLASAEVDAGDDGVSDLLRALLLVLVAVVPIVGALLVVRLPSPVPATPPPRPARPAGAKSRSGAKRKKSNRRRR
ncbi:MAG TPA: hypothetical protein VHF27_10900 [Acidimicrobiales bacterium]|nr:hypothetical protein [Acidimicrobiales bacterium]